MKTWAFIHIFFDIGVYGPHVPVSDQLDDLARLLVDNSRYIQSCDLVLVEDDLITLVNQVGNRAQRLVDFGNLKYEALFLPINCREVEVAFAFVRDAIIGG